MRLHLIDGTFELFRAHYSRRPPRLSLSGQDVKGTVGVVSTLIRLVEDPYDDVTHLAVAFDNPVESFRNRLYSGYKSGEGLDPAVLAQFELVEDAVDALGIVVWSMGEFEADDALATGAARWRDEVDQVRILSPDKDLGQCVDDGHRVVQFDTVRRRVIDTQGVRARNGVDPESIPDWLALVGDTADGIPGIPGFGRKTASALLQHYRTVDAIPDDPRTWPTEIRGAAKLAATLAAMRKEAALYRKLAVLITDVPLAESLDDLRWRGANREKFERVSARVGGFGVNPRRWR